MAYKNVNEAARDEHAVIGGVAGKKVFVVDNAGNQITDFGGSKYATNHLDDYTTASTTYVGQEDLDGNWKLTKIDETGNFPVYTYASLANNSSLTTYALAWAARTTATYGIYSAAF